MPGPLLLPGRSRRRRPGYGGAGTRNARLHPFDSRSMWNMPIGSDAVLRPAGLADALGATNQRVTVDPLIAGFSESDPVYEMRTITYVRNSSGAIVNLTGVYVIPAGTMVHVPAGTVHDARWNGIAGFLLQGTGGRYAFHGQAVEVDTGTGLAPGWGRTSKTHEDGTAGPANIRGWVDLLGSGRSGAHGGGGNSGIGGCVRAWEWDAMGLATYPQHALSMNLHGLRFLSNALSGYRWPAFKADTGYNDPAHQNYYGRTGVSDGEGGTYDGMRMGTLLCLPSGYDRTWITDPKAFALSRSLEYYGAYVCDVTTSDRHAFTVEKTRESAWNNQGTTFHRELMTVINALKYVDNNSETTIGGGGTPRVPLLPDPA